MNNIDELMKMASDIGNKPKLPFEVAIGGQDGEKPSTRANHTFRLSVSRTSGTVRLEDTTQIDPSTLDELYAKYANPELIDSKELYPGYNNNAGPTRVFMDELHSKWETTEDGFYAAEAQEYSSLSNDVYPVAQLLRAIWCIQNTYVNCRQSGAVFSEVSSKYLPYIRRAACGRIYDHVWAEIVYRCRQLMVILQTQLYSTKRAFADSAVTYAIVELNDFLAVSEDMCGS